MTAAVLSRGVNSVAVRVAVEDGEEVRRQLMERDLLDHGLEIQQEDGYIYIPVVEEPGSTEELKDGDVDFDVVEREFEERETQTKPGDILGYEPSYEVVGDVALVEDEDEGQEVADALVEADNNVRAVYRVDSPVQGRERTRKLVYLAGREGTEVVHREYGVELEVDLADVYFSPRLANERQRVRRQVEDGERAFDMFAGCGPYTVALALKGADVVACDVNPDAVRYLRRNVERNGVGDWVEVHEADARDVAGEIQNSADRVVMNLPHTADDFLDAAVEAAADEAVLHYYDIRHESDLFDGAEELVREAADHGGYDVEVLERVEVRSYAPYDYNVCLDVRLTRRES